MKSYDIDYGGSGWTGQYTGDLDDPTLHCSKCHCLINLNKDKYSISREISVKEKIKELFGSKIETKYLCQQCHRNEQIEKIV